MELVSSEKDHCARFSEKHTFSLLKEMDQIKIKVYAFLSDSDESQESQERLISCLIYEIDSGELLDLFDQKPHAKRLGDNKCKVLF